MTSQQYDFIRQITDRIVESYNPQKIILFGSQASGTTRNDSDVDLLIIKETEKRRQLRAREVYESLGSLNGLIPIDILVYTPEEVEKRKIMGDFFVQRILKEGNTLYDSKTTS